MAEKIICPHCRFVGEAAEAGIISRTKKKRAAVQICPRCGNPIKVKYKTKGKMEERK